MKEIKVTASLEDYLEAIYEIIEEKQSVRAIDISRKLNVGRSSVTEALKNLAEKKLVNHGRYEMISLTQAGNNVAKSVIEKHKTLYDFFNKVLGLSSQESQENACKVEHVISTEAFRRLEKFVNFNSSLPKNFYLEEFKHFCKD